MTHLEHQLQMLHKAGSPSFWEGSPGPAKVQYYVSLCGMETDLVQQEGCATGTQVCTDDQQQLSNNWLNLH